MSIQKAEMSVEQIENGQIVEQVVYPFVEYDHVTMENGMDIMSMIRDDVSTPTVTHDATSWRVGQGDGDVSKSIVDSSVAIMTIKGQTYQNILPSPSLRNSMTNGKTMQKLNEGYDSVNTVDGVCKSAILKGCTLVNVYGNIQKTTSSVATYNDEWITLEANGGYARYFHSKSDMLKPSTKYLIIVDVKENTLQGSNSLQINDYGITDTVFNTSMSVSGSGIFKLVSTTKDDLTNKTIDLRCLLTSSNTSGLITFRVMVIEYQEGMENWDIPYFEGMQSVKLPVLTTTGKNLFDGTVVKSSVNVTTGEIFPYENSEWLATNYINVKNINSLYFQTSQLSNMNIVYMCFDENKNFIGYKGFYNSLTGIITPLNNTHYIRLRLPSDIDVSTTQIEQGTQPTSYEPYKTNILSCNEEATLRAIGEVKDELNLLNGELTQRVYNIVFNESFKDRSVSVQEFENVYRFGINVAHISNNLSNDHVMNSICDKFSIDTNYTGDYEHCYYWGSTFYFFISKNKIEGTIEAFKTYITNNPIKFQTILATPTVKTVDLSSSGNWEKIVYNGASNESWSYRQEYDTTNTYCFKNNKTITNGLLFNSTCLAFSDTLPINGLNADKHSIHINGQPNVLIKIDKKLITEPTVEQLQLYLSSNPVTIWYQTQTQQDSTQVKQPIFFKDGLIQLSSGADNSLIPTLDYQAKTSNSYVMDLMKTNTKYTMKAKSASGTFTIDGTSYGAGTNGTFTTPTSMTNKLLVMSNKTNEEVMILEGDVTSKTIPYFKGIKSAFEDKSKIEVLSTGKNLYSHGDSAFTPERDGWYFINGDRETLFGDKVHKDCGQGAWFYLEGGRYYFNVVGNDNVKTLQVVGEKERLYGSGATIPKGWYALRMRVQNANQEVSITNVMVEKDTETNYEPYKSNSTKIPLLSPLRGLPNGVRDEIILDRVNHKAKIVQRVGEIVLDGNNNIGIGGKTTAFYFEGLVYLPSAKLKTPNGSYAFCDKVMTSNTHHSAINYVRTNTGASQYLILGVCGEHLTTVDVKGVQDYLKKNPVTVYYELETPIITEVNLEGYPYVYKGGHIFLNTEIAPTTEVTYSINQAHQIESSNEDILRHQNEINHLYELIAQYVQVQYEAELIDIALQG